MVGIWNFVITVNKRDYKKYDFSAIFMVSHTKVVVAAVVVGDTVIVLSDQTLDLLIQFFLELSPNNYYKSIGVDLVI